MAHPDLALNKMALADPLQLAGDGSPHDKVFTVAQASDGVIVLRTERVESIDSERQGAGDGEQLRPLSQVR